MKALLILLCALASADALPASRRDRAEEAARLFVPAFITKQYDRAAAVATIDPVQWVAWFERRFPTTEPFKSFRIWDADIEDDDSLVHVRIAGETVVHGIYVQVDREGKVTGLLSLRELLELRAPQLDAALGKTIETLDAIENGSMPISAIRRALVEHKRTAAQYLRVLDRHLALLEGESGLER